MKLCFAWTAKAFAWAAGACANMAWGAPPVLLCWSDCCNNRLKRNSDEFTEMLDRIKSRISTRVERYYTI